MDGLPPSALLRWGRMLHASRILSDERVSVAAAARILGFHNAASLRRTFQAVTGTRLGGYEREALLAEVARLFSNAVDAARS